MEINEIDLAWLAGLLEGEGSFMMNRNIKFGKLYYYPKVVVGMTDEDIIQRAASIFGTSVYMLPKIDNRKQAWRAQLGGAKAAVLMQLLLPQMGIRRSKKIQEILLAYGN